MIYRRIFADLDWVTSEGHAAQTTDLKKVSGVIKAVRIAISSVTANPTVSVTLTDITESGLAAATLATFSGLADGTLHVKFSESHKNSQDADFNPIPCYENDLRISVDPSADPGGSGQTLTVTVTLYVEA
ncbi:MAG: hypothetical protein ACYTEQ_31385 [Planctomycetota bacterium]|jgi:hypothetical protein